MKKKITLDEARDVINAERDRERQADITKKRSFIGRFFKYHNSYGSGERWWLYATVTGVTDYAHLQGWKFQHTSSGQIKIECRDYMTGIGNNQSWKEIQADEFWREAAKVLADAGRLLGGLQSADAVDPHAQHRER